MPRSTITLEARDQQIAALAAQGVRQGVIAKQLGVHRHSITRRLAQASVQAAIARLQARVFEQNCTVVADRFESALAQQHARYLAKQEERKQRQALAKARRALRCRPSPGESGLDPHEPIAQYLRQQAQQQQAQAAALPGAHPQSFTSWPP